MVRNQDCEIVVVIGTGAFGDPGPLNLTLDSNSALRSDAGTCHHLEWIAPYSPPLYTNMSRKIILYDIASNLKPQAWSPNCWKARQVIISQLPGHTDEYTSRYVLNYKNLPYETVYVSYPDIEQLWKTLGLSPLAEQPSTTLPIISVPSTDGGPPSVIADSFNIAIFLDHEFPNTPAVIPENTGALQASWVNTLSMIVAPAFRPLILSNAARQLDERGAAYFRRTREKAFGIPLEQIAPPGEKRDAAIEKMKSSLSRLAGMLDANGGEQGARDWVMGSKGPTLADFALGGTLHWLRLMGDQETWEIVAAWNGARWALHLDKLKAWTQAP